MFRRWPVSRLSTQMTSSPSARNRSQRCEPDESRPAGDDRSHGRSSSFDAGRCWPNARCAGSSPYASVAAWINSRWHAGDQAWTRRRGSWRSVGMRPGVTRARPDGSAVSPRGRWRPVRAPRPSRVRRRRRSRVRQPTRAGPGRRFQNGPRLGRGHGGRPADGRCST